YEKQWKEKRIVKVQEVIANVLNESNLNEKYASLLTVDDDHLKKNVTDSRLREMIEFQADGLLQEQEKELADRDMIETYVKLKNSEYSVNLSIESYLSQFESKDTDSVKNTIENDVQKELDNRMNMEVAKQNEEPIKEQEKIILEHGQHVPVGPTMSGIDDTDDLPFGDIEPER